MFEAVSVWLGLVVVEENCLAREARRGGAVGVDVEVAVGEMVESVLDASFLNV